MVTSDRRKDRRHGPENFALSEVGEEIRHDIMNYSSQGLKRQESLQG